MTSSHKILIIYEASLGELNPKEIKTINDETIYKAVQDEDVLKKVGQLKKAMQKFKEKAEALEKELAQLKS